MFKQWTNHQNVIVSSIWLLQIQLEVDLVRLDLWRTLFLNHGTICLMKLMASTMLSAAVKRQYSSVLPLLRHCLPVFDEICVTAMNLLYFLQGNTNQSCEYTTWQVRCALVLSVTNWTYCGCTAIRQIWLEVWPELDLAGFPKNGQFPDLPEPELKSGTSLVSLHDIQTTNPELWTSSSRQMIKK